MCALERGFGKKPEGQLHPERERHLAVDPKLKKFVAGQKGVIKAFLEAREELVSKKKKRAKIKGVIVDLIRSLNPGDRTHAYRVQVKDRVFFVKEQRLTQVPSRLDPLEFAAVQSHALERAEKLLSERKWDFPNLEIVKPHLAWTSKGVSFLVTDFHEGKLVIEVREKIPENILKQFRELSILFLEKDLLGVYSVNAIWVPRENKIVIFDLLDYRLLHAR